MSRFFRAGNDSSDSDSSSSDEESLLSEGSDNEAPPQEQPKKPMSRFLKTGSASSSSESSEESGGDESDSDESVKPKKTGRFKVGAASDSGSDEEGPRTVKSAYQRRIEEMQAIENGIDNALKINDWNAINNGLSCTPVSRIDVRLTHMTNPEFDKFTRLVEQQRNLGNPVPSIFLRLLKSLESSVAETQAREKAATKKMNATNARALNGVKQKLRKLTKEYESFIKSYEENSEAYQAVENPEPVAPRRRQYGSNGMRTRKARTVGRAGKTMTFSTEALYKNLQEIQEARGRKNTDRNAQVHLLEQIRPTAVTPYGKIRVLLTLISARFDYNPTASFMPIELWQKALKEINSLITLLLAEPLYLVSETAEDYDELVERVPVDKNPIILVEYRPARDRRYFEERQQDEATYRVVIKRLEHIYCKPDAVIQHFESTLPNAPSPLPPTSELIASLATKLYKSSSPLLRTRAMLAHIYHTGLQNDFPRARDMLLMSHVQESINSADAQTQILFNRAVVQLGLSAFRCGMIKEAHAVLGDIFASQRVKELLAQGTGPRGSEAPTAARVLLPFHVHINTELAEAVFLVSCMLVEAPLIAGEQTKSISKPFRRLLEFADRQAFAGPPESTRDCVVQATRALLAGEWERCKELVTGIKIWGLMGSESEKVKEMLGVRIQEESLRTYLFTYSAHYSSLSLPFLARTFSLSLQQTTSIVSRMIWTDELAASLDSAANAVVFRRTEVNRTQASALALAERVAGLVEMSEKALDVRVGGRDGGAGGWGGERADRERETGATGGGERRRGGQGRPRGGGGGGRGGRFAQGLGSRMVRA
ncbi:eukaryotic translation initiation factor 3 subunit 8 [Ceratobasidium sp. AG-Ba]|nr:eukaryotic translation initiation factor 3 subunit 8 [Ceratobasidium sp. AG-Ba]